MQRAHAIDGIRGLAALTVFIHHAWLYQVGNLKRPPAETAWDFLRLELRLGLICFFVLSGYLLYKGFTPALIHGRGSLRIGSYIKRRSARILPAYFVCIAISYILLVPIADTPGVRIPEGDMWLFLVFGQNYSELTLLKLVPVTWTLAIEVIFYIFLPIVVIYMNEEYRQNADKQERMLYGFIVLGLLWHAAVFFLFDNDRILSRLFPAYLPYFALGMILALWIEYNQSEGIKLRMNAWVTTIVTAIGFAIVGLGGWWHARSDGFEEDAAVAILHDLPAAIGCAMIIAVAAIGRGPIVWLLERKWLVTMGTYSYGFYLYHITCMLLVRASGLFPEGGFWTTVIVTLPLSLLMGAMSWYCFEKPFIERVESSRASQKITDHAAP